MKTVSGKEEATSTDNFFKLTGKMMAGAMAGIITGDAFSDDQQIIISSAIAGALIMLFIFKKTLQNENQNDTD